MHVCFAICNLPNLGILHSRRLRFLNYRAVFSFFWVVRRLLRDHTGVPSKFVFHRRIHQETRDKFRSHGGAIRINIGARMHMFIHIFIILLHPPSKDMRQHRTAMISVVDTGAAHVDNTSACRHGVFDHVVFTTYLCM